MEGFWQLVLFLWLCKCFFRFIYKMSTDENMPDARFQGMFEHLKQSKKFRPIGGLERFKLPIEKSLHKEVNKLVRDLQGESQVDFWTWIEVFTRKATLTTLGQAEKMYAMLALTREATRETLLGRWPAMALSDFPWADLEVFDLAQLIGEARGEKSRAVYVRAQWQELVWKPSESAPEHVSRAFSLYQELQNATGEEVMPATSMGEFGEKLMRSMARDPEIANMMYWRRNLFTASTTWL